MFDKMIRPFLIISLLVVSGLLKGQCYTGGCFGQFSCEAGALLDEYGDCSDDCRSGFKLSRERCVRECDAAYRWGLDGAALALDRCLAK